MNSDFECQYWILGLDGSKVKRVVDGILFASFIKRGRLLWNFIDKGDFLFMCTQAKSGMSSIDPC